jgi:hypothetical protein
MQKPSKATLSELVEARRKFPTSRRAAGPARMKTCAGRQAVKRFVESNLGKGGFDFDAFRDLVKWSEAEARLRIADLRADADRQSHARLQALHREVDGLNHRLTAEFFLLDTAAEITALGITLDSSHIGPTPENNWARFFHDVSHGDGFDVGSGVVSFGFLWQNPSDKAVVVNVHGYLVLDGFCSVFSNGGFIALAFAELNVDADLVIHELWNDPPTSPVAQSTQSQNALTLSCESLGFIEPGCADGRSLAAGFDLEFDQFMMPPKGTAMFEVSCSLDWSMDDGEIQSDFSFGDRRVLCPGVLIAVL